MATKKPAEEPPERVTATEAAAMAADYEANPPRADEILSVTLGPAYLRMGRPAADSESSGKTPVVAVRLPDVLRDELKRRADELGSAPSELIRVAIAEYFENHPARS